MPSSWIKDIPPSARHTTTRYQAIYRDSDGRQRSAGIFARKGDAKKALAGVIVDTERGDWIDPRLHRTNVKAYAEQWLAAKQLAVTTRRKYAGVLRREIIPTFGAMQLGEVKPPHIKTWIADQAGRLHPTTVHGNVQVAKSLFNDAVHDGFLPVSPVRLRAGDLPRKEPTTFVFLTYGQTEKLIRAFREDKRAFVHVAAYTGMRWSEIVALQWKNVDLERKVVKVRRAEQRDDAGRVSYAPPKTKTSRREISLDPETVQVLRLHKLASSDTEPGSLVFPTRTGLPVRHSSFMRDHWWPAVVKALALADPLEIACPACGARRWMRCLTEQDKTAEETHKARLGNLPTFHDLRHSHLSHLMRTLDPLTVAKRAGHSNVAMTLNVYGHVRHDHAEAISRAIEGFREEGSA